MRNSSRNFDRTATATIMTNERKGFSVVEVIVAMVLLAIAVSSLAALTYSVSQSAMSATANAYRNGVAEPTVNLVKTIQVIIVPKNTKFKPDTAAFIRTKARTSHVLCTDCVAQ